MTTIVEIGDLEFPQSLGGATAGFWFEELVDWYTPGESKTQPPDRPQDHGSFRNAKDWSDSVTPSVKAHYVGETYAQVLENIARVARLRDGNPRTMRVTDDLGASSREVSIRFVKIPDTHGRLTIDFSIDMLAADPRRYGDEVSVSTGLPIVAGGLVWPITWPITWGGGGADGRVILTNAGTADTRPRMLEVTGGLAAGFTIDEVGTGRQVRFERLIPDGSVVFLNPRTGRAYIDAPGNDVSGYLTRSDWPTVPAQGQTILQLNSLGASTGTPTLTARSPLRSDW